MNKIISMILLCALLLAIFSGCSTPKAPADMNDPGDEIESTPNDEENEKNPDNVIDPTPDDDEGEKDPANEIDPTPDDNGDEQNPGNEIELPHHFHNENGPTNNNAGNSIDEVALKAIFEQLRADADANAKLEFWVAYEQEYYELKNSDEYANCDWMESLFTVLVSCSYDDAVNEDWYQQCSATDVRSLNEAFFRQYGVDILNGQQVNASWSTGMSLLYSSPDGFCSDYDAIKVLLQLGYVKQISIGYIFGLPGCYFME